MSQETGFRGASFPPTRWSLLAAGPDRESGERRAAWEHLARRYLRPVAAYVRARGARDDEEARETAQDFFLWMLERSFLDKADPTRGRFRGFVKRSLVNFLHDRERRRRTVKRGGEHVTLSLSDADDEHDALPVDPGRTPEQVLDDLWRQELLARAADALERELASRGKEVVFAVFRDWYLQPEDGVDHATLAERHGLSRTDVGNHLALAKERYRAQLRRAVLETVHGDDDLRAELAWLFEERA